MPADRLAVFRKTLRDQRRSTALWALGFLVMSVVYVSYYQQIKADPALVDSMNNLPEGLTQALNFSDLTSAPGFLKGTVFGLLGPLLMVIFAVLAGTRAIAGEEEGGVLDVYLAHPLSRRRLVAERFAALTLQILILGVVVALIVTLLASSMDFGLTAGKVFLFSFGLALLGLCFATVALAVGGATGQRSLALAASAGTAVVTYLLNALVSQIDALSGLRYLSPFHYYLDGNPLVSGYSIVDVLVLVLVPFALLAATIVAFDRRDLSV